MDQCVVVDAKSTVTANNWIAANGLRTPRRLRHNTENDGFLLLVVVKDDLQQEICGHYCQGHEESCEYPVSLLPRNSSELFVRAYRRALQMMSISPRPPIRSLGK